MRAVLDLLLPPRSPGCGVEGALICAPCRRPLERRLGEPPGVPIGLALPLPPGIAQLEWVSRFSGPARAAIHALKYGGERRLAVPLGELLAERWRRAGCGGDLFVPVPIHASRRRERGFDQAELLAAACSARLGRPWVVALERQERTSAQHALGRAERARNVGGAFVARPAARSRVRGRWVVLLDDVVTTGATLSACAAALYESGAACVSAVAVARES